MSKNKNILEKELKKLGFSTYQITQIINKYIKLDCLKFDKIYRMGVTDIDGFKVIKNETALWIRKNNKTYWITFRLTDKDKKRIKQLIKL